VRLFGRAKKRTDGSTADGRGAEPGTGMAGLLKDLDAKAENEFVKFVVEHLERIHEPGGYEREKKEISDFMDLGMGRKYLEALDDLQLSIGEVLILAVTRGRGGKAEIVTRWTVRGIHARSLAGIEPTGEEIAIDGVTITTIRDYRLRSDYSYWQIPELTHKFLGG
jgi:hypothetical protein